MQQIYLTLVKLSKNNIFSAEISYLIPHCIDIGHPNDHITSAHILPDVDLSGSIDLNRTGVTSCFKKNELIKHNSFIQPE
jgi:hypothetical protein